MSPLLDDLGVALPVLAAPMAGGPTTPAMVTAASAVGSMGFVAAGYKTPDGVADEIRTVRKATQRFGLNLFAPNLIAVDPAEYAEYHRQLQREAERFGVAIEVTDPVEDDDSWQQKLHAIISDPVPVVSFTFGIPDAAAMRSLKKAGSLILLTVTSADEAKAANEAGADALVVQASAAGGHSATFTPRVVPPAVPIGELLRGIRSVTSHPLIAAGGISTADDVASALEAGADAVTVGTALLRSAESGASETHQNALARPPLLAHRRDPGIHRSTGPRTQQRLHRPPRCARAVRLSGGAPLDERPAAGCCSGGRRTVTSPLGWCRIPRGHLGNDRADPHPTRISDLTNGTKLFGCREREAKAVTSSADG